jgi:1,4-alpha-glucan branching enzyme
VGALHAVLASAKEGDEPAFAPVPYSSRHHGEWVERVSAVCERLAAALRNQPPEGVDAAVWGQARSLWLGGEAVWRERVASLGELRVSALCSRVHGDLHLGQILQTSTTASAPEWWVVDFEGEPLRSLEERRAPDLPLRDVAGMWRSFEYAAATAGVPAERALPLQEAFIGGWIERMPLPEGDWAGLLKALVWEKSIYEALYEIEHRPGWLWIPLRTLA